MRTLLGKTTRLIDRRSRLFGPASLALWFSAIAFQVTAAARAQSTTSYLTLGILLALFFVTHIRLGALRRAHDRGLRSSISFLYTTRYMSEIRGFADAGTFMADLRHSRDLARRSGTPAVVVCVRMASLEAVRDQHGDHMGSKAVSELSRTLQRITRGDDLAAYLGAGQFAILLPDCSFDQGEQFILRIPAVVTTTAGGEPVTIPVQVERYDVVTTELDELLSAIEGSPSRPGPLRPAHLEPKTKAEAA